MKTHENKQNLLNPATFTQEIKQAPEFAETLNEGHHLSLAIGRAALGAAERHPQYEFRANMLRTIAGLEDFVDAQHAADRFRTEHGHTKFRNIDRDEVDAYKDAKKTITQFNHTLRDTIEAGANEDISFNDLLVLMTQQYGLITNRRDTRDFYDMARSTIIGMRNELAVEMILINNNVDFEQGTEAEDARGGDFIINGVPIDIKASHATAERARIASAQQHRDANRVVWSHIDYEDFEGKLMLSPEAEQKVARNLLPEINRACHTNYLAEVA